MTETVAPDGQGNPRAPLDGVGKRLNADAIRDWTVAAESVRPRLSVAVARIKQSYGGLPDEELQAMVDYLTSLRALADIRRAEADLRSALNDRPEMGSVTQKVLMHAKIPVVVYR